MLDELGESRNIPIPTVMVAPQVVEGLQEALL
jgi:hypothetical protein